MAHQNYPYSAEININYDVAGEGARPLLLIHGFGASLESWNDIVPALGKHFRVYRLDLKGHGLSSKPHDDRYSLLDQATIVAAFINRHDLHDVVLVGHSYGGAVALITYFTLLDSFRPNPITALILIDSAGYPQSLPFFVSLLQKPVVGSLIQNLVPAHLRAAYILRKVFFDRHKITPERIDRYARYYDLPGAHYALTSCARQIIPADADAVIAKFPTITARTLIIWGANDSAIPLSIGLHLHHDIPRSNLITIEKSGHVPQEEQPVKTAEEIERFLSEGQH